MFVKKSAYDEVVANNAELNQQVETLTSERDAAITDRDALQAQIDEGASAEIEMEATLTAVVNSLDAIDDSIQNALTPQEKAEALVSLVSTLRQNPGAKSATVTSKTEAPAAGKSTEKTIVSESKGFMENLQAVAEEFSIN